MRAHFSAVAWLGQQARRDDQFDKNAMVTPAVTIVGRVRRSSYIRPSSTARRAELPVRLSQLGCIEFKDGELQSKGMIILKKLLAFELVTLRV